MLVGCMLDGKDGLCVKKSFYSKAWTAWTACCRGGTGAASRYARQPLICLTSLNLDTRAPSRNLWPDGRGDVRRSEVRVGGMLGGKAGLCYCHMGTSASRLDPLRAALAAKSGLPRSQLPVSLHGVSAAISEPCSACAPPH